MSKNHRLYMLIKLAVKEFGKDKGYAIGMDAEKNFASLVEENKNEPEPVKAHTVKEVYPTVAVQKAMEKNGWKRKEATEWISRQIWAETEKNAKLMRFGIKATGIYKKVPHMFITQLEGSFRRDMGFDYKIYDTEKTRGKFDMLKCPYHDNFTRLGYPELTDIFCTNDDIEDGHMHDKLTWARTKTLGRGGDCCDFDIYVDKNAKKD